MRLWAALAFAALASCAAAKTSPVTGASIADAAAVPDDAVADAGAALVISAADADAPVAAPPIPDVVYWATPQPIADRMVEIARIDPSDVVYELGCGDARVLVTAAKRYGMRGFGFDVDPRRVREARENARENGVDHLVQIEQKNIFTLDLSPADVVFLFMLPRINQRLMPQLRKMRPGSRIVSHEFSMDGAVPIQTVHVPGPPDGPPVTVLRASTTKHTIYLWEVPWKTRGKHDRL